MKEHFSRFLGHGDRLHFTAHSHHPWPDVTYSAHVQSWLDAAVLVDDKWDKVFGEVLPEAQSYVATQLNLSSPGTVVFAPNTHELTTRILSCLARPVRVLTTDAEFHSFARQISRLEEEGLAHVTRVPAQPFDVFPDRFVEAVQQGVYDLVFISQVHFDSGYVVPDLKAVVDTIETDHTFVVVDGYHGFMAVPTDFGPLEERAFYLGGGYKYAMAGEGAAFAHCPDGFGLRPLDTGWFAGPDNPSRVGGGTGVAYRRDAGRFLGATFDPSGLYRFNAVQKWLQGLGVTVASIHAHVLGLQEAFLEQLRRINGLLGTEMLLPPAEVRERGHFLTFRVPAAHDAEQALRDLEVVTDCRSDRLRVGFGIYHAMADVDELVRRLPLARAALEARLRRPSEGSP